jgi:N-acetyl-gamma-glutamyl-phosphate reductase
MAQKKKKVSIVGASGYTGVELLRLLLRHPSVKVARVTSRQLAGKPVYQVFPSLGRSPLVFEDPRPEKLIQDSEIVFTAVPHHTAMALVPELLKGGNVKVIDLSADFRLHDSQAYESWYGAVHLAPDLLDQAVFGLPELHRDRIKKARLIANPGCYPTSVILGLAPLLKQGWVEGEGIIVDSKSGVSGAGRNLSLGSLFCEVGEAFRAYKVGGEHRHIPEMEQELSRLARQPIRVAFTPHLVPISRGILSTIYVKPAGGFSEQGLERLYGEFYQKDCFVRLCPPGDIPDTGRVRGSNYCDIGWRYDRRTGRLIVVSAIDNLVKGAAGQAVQNMNLISGWEENLGLEQMPLYP